MAGGVAGAAARQAIEQALGSSSRHAFPVATFLINLTGAFALGWLLEHLARAAPARARHRLVRLTGGTGFCGAFTTYSTLAVETVQLGRHGATPLAAVYVLASVAGGLLAVATGVAVATGHARWRGAPGHPELPLDPDADPAGEQE